MTLYYDDGQVTIYHGDAREVLPELPKADLMLTDPPYGVGMNYASYARLPEVLALGAAEA